MASHAPEPQSGRETRLLVLVVGVAVVVLLLLAQWRFPYSSMSVVTPSAAPLAGLAARATFDEMSSTLGDVVARVSPLTIVVPLEPVPTGDEEDSAAGGAASADDEEAADAAPAGGAPAAWGLAVRVRGDLAVMHAPPGLVPAARPDAAIEIVAHDLGREIALLRVPDAAGAAVTDLLAASVRTFPGFTYVAALSPTPVGPSVQPVFVGRAESVADPRWSHALVPASVGPGLSPGTLVFSLNSRFIGLVVGVDTPLIVPAPAIETLVQAIGTTEGAQQ